MLTKRFLIVVPLVEPYMVYDRHKIYPDGLAFLGYVHTPKLPHPYAIQQPVPSQIHPGLWLRSLLAVSSGLHEE